MTNKQPVGKRQTLEEVMDKCDNPDLWTPSQIICFISDYLDGSIGKELPEDANDISEKPKGLSKEVLEAMEDLRKAMSNHPMLACQETEAILNALDNQLRVENKCSKCEKESIAQIRWCTTCYDKFCKDINTINTNPNPWLQDSAIEMLEAISVPPPYPYRDCKFPDEKSIISIDFGKEGGDYTVETKYKKEGDNLVIEEINEIKPKKSVWKPVSELPKQNSDIYSDIPCIVEDALGYHTYAVYSVNAFWDLRYGTKKMVEGYLSSASPIRYCTLTDFINQQNSLLDRVERLERIIGGKNG